MEVIGTSKSKMSVGSHWCLCGCNCRCIWGYVAHNAWTDIIRASNGHANLVRN